MKEECIKCVIVGDGGVGKTSLILSYAIDVFDPVYPPGQHDYYDVSLTVDERSVSLGIWDTAGQKEYDRLRPLCYPCTDVFVLCYDINNVDSLVNVAEKWHQELTDHRPNVPLILVGTKLDLRKEWAEPIPNNKRVTTSQGFLVAQQIKAYAHFECSSKTQEKLKDVFEEAARAALRPKEETSKRRCSVL